MLDYRRVFGEDVALGLGLGQPPKLDSEKAVAKYRADPAEAFSQMAELMNPNGVVSLSFFHMVESSGSTPTFLPENQDRPSRKEKTA